MDDIFLLAFLRHKKYDVKNAFKILCNFYAMKKKYFRILTDFKPSELNYVLEKNQLTVQPFRCPDGCSIGIWRIGHHNFETTTLEDLTATLMTMGLMLIRIEASQVCGLVMIWDWKSLSFQEFNKISLHRAAHYAYDIL
ncbi:alpha-tocopherol transfer protein-like, partial [Stegodyphus dumicola]